MVVDTRMRSDNGGSVPVPDPTILTTQQLYREIAAIQLNMESRIAAINEKAELAAKVLDQRIRDTENLSTVALGDLTKRMQEGLDKVEHQVQTSLDKVQVELTRWLIDSETRVNAKLEEKDKIIDLKVAALQSIHEEKFASIRVQFVERDTRTEQTSRDSKVAVDAALQAAKEAVGEQNKSSALAIAKSEASTTKQIDQQGTLIQSTTAGINDKIDDIKERFTSYDARMSAFEARTEGRSKGLSDGWGYLIGGIMALVGIGAFVVSVTRHVP